mgnify:CR=1 FL=1
MCRKLHDNVTQTLCVVVASSLERFVEDPPTAMNFLVLVLQTFLSSTVALRRQIGILEH